MSSLERLFVVAVVLFFPVFAHAVAFTNSYYTGITAGSPFQLTWTGDNTPVEINLLNGDPANLQFVSTVASGATGFSYSWTPPPITAQGVYALSIKQSGATNYSPQFTIYTSANGSQSPTAQTTITSFASTSTRVVASTTITPTSIVSAAIVPSSLIPSNSTTLPSVTSIPPYPTVNRNSTYTGATGTVAPVSVHSYPSASATGAAGTAGVTSAGNFSAIATPRFTGAAGKAWVEVNVASVAMIGALGWGLLMA